VADGTKGSKPPVRGPPFERLGRRIVAHPWQVIALWAVLVVLALPLLPHLGDATTSSSLSLPANAPSSEESFQANLTFPSASAPSDTLILLAAPSITDAQGRNATLGLTRAIGNDHDLDGVRSVLSLYTSYEQYWEGEAAAALGVLGAGTAGPTSALAGVQGVAALTWGVAGNYTLAWQGLVASFPSGTPASEANYPTYQRLSSELSGVPQALANLSLFYNGDPGLGNGFNGTADCAASAGAVDTCADAVERAVLLPLGPSPLVATVASGMSVENYTSWPTVQSATAHVLAPAAGLPFSTLLEFWLAFPQVQVNDTVLADAAEVYVGNGTVATYDPRVPASIYQEFVSPADNLSVVIVTLKYSDDGPQDSVLVPELQVLTERSLNWTGSSGVVSFVQTGDAALVVNEQNVINADTSTILPITIVLLLLISALYFRAPFTPILVLLVIGVALLLGLGGMVVLTMLTGQVTQTSLTLLLTFVLGVGTDYSVFLTARYREELRRGASSQESLVTAVTWAGESVATSGSTVILAALAMTFSGTELISDWGRVIAVGVGLALLVALTLVPAFLTLVGPRIFWPYRGARFQRQAQRVEETFRTRNTYFHRASRFSYRRPWVIIGLVALLSLPLVYLALTAPLSYAYFQQLPPDQPSAAGLQTLSGNFGPGYVFPLDLLVTFGSPLVGAANATNVGEFAQAWYVAHVVNGTAGVHSVHSLVGTGGENLSTWLSLPTQPAPERALLLGTLSSYLGRDGRTLSYQVALTSNGNSNAAVDTLNAIETNLSLYHPATATIAALYYGGAPSLTKDLQAQLSVSDEGMFSIIVVGLLLILFVALGSAILPPRAVVTIALSVAWAWAITFVVFAWAFGLSLFFYIPPVLFLLVMGLGMDYDIFIMTRVREERLKGKDPQTAVVDAIAHTAGIITAAAVILAGAFFALTFAHITLLRVLGFAVGAAILLDAAVIRTYLVPAILGIGRDGIWWAPKFVRKFRRSPADVPITQPVADAPPGR
jgi:putative drug exporter of the RND superfamily